MVQNNPICFTGEGQKKRSTFGILKDAAINVGATVAVGATAGGAVGKIASLTPYKPNEAALHFQYEDIFEKAINSNENPAFLSKGGKALTDIVDDGRNALKNAKTALSKIEDASTVVASCTDEVFANEEAKNVIKEFLKNTANDIPDDAFTKENVIDKLKSYIDDLGNSANAEKDKLDDAFKSFMAKIKTTTSKDITEIAEAGAKHLRKRAIIGTGIAIGIMGALVLNILKTYGVIGKKPKQQEQTPPQYIGTHQE